jgi:hypothetical protein
VLAGVVDHEDGSAAYYEQSTYPTVYTPRTHRFWVKMVHCKPTDHLWSQVPRNLSPLNTTLGIGTLYNCRVLYVFARSSPHWLQWRSNVMRLSEGQKFTSVVNYLVCCKASYTRLDIIRSISRQLSSSLHPRCKHLCAEWDRSIRLVGLKVSAAI